ncbi:MAG: hypothetical protein N3G22_02780 [Candidatus Micrarchaeota archaeon]|nr:hypothetical protein [Candidatus Micrarchaeota archaeon]
MQEITIITQNKIGALAEICEYLGRNGVNIEAISAYGLGDSGVVRLVTGDVTTATRVLSTKKGISFKTSEIVVAKLNDQPGELGKIARKLARAEIDIESIYILSRSKGITEVAIKTSDIEGTRKALK